MQDACTSAVTFGSPCFEELGEHFKKPATMISILINT